MIGCTPSRGAGKTLSAGDWLNGRAFAWGAKGSGFDSRVPDQGCLARPCRSFLNISAHISVKTGYSSIGRALGSGPRGSQFKPEYPEVFPRMPDALTRRRFVVTGRVQGIGFRWFAQRWAERLGVRGWICNRDDGTVASEAEGRSQALAEFERHLREGPAGAQVDAVEATELKAAGRPSSFDIL